MKWNESGFRPPLCTYRLNWARRTSWGWWDDWDDTVLQTQDSKFEPWRSEAEHATSRSRRLPTILTFTRGWGRNNFVSFKPPRPGTEPRTLAWKAAVLTTTLGPPPRISRTSWGWRDESDDTGYPLGQVGFALMVFKQRLSISKRGMKPILSKYWPNIWDDDTTISQHWYVVSIYSVNCQSCEICFATMNTTTHVSNQVSTHIHIKYPHLHKALLT